MDNVNRSKETEVKNIRAILVDDEEAARVTLSKLLEWNASDVEVVATCDSVDNALNAIASYNPDLVFLDIEMPVKNGFDLLQSVDRLDFEVIFVTAYDQFAIQAFKHHAIAYLLKPIDEDELKDAIDRARKHIIDPLDTESLLNMFSMINEVKPSFNKIAIPTLEGLELIKVDKILQCSAEGNYTQIHRFDESPLLVSKNLKYIEDQLSNYKQFVRVHHSHIVNLEHVKRYIKGKGGSLILENGNSVPVSRARKDDLMEFF